MAKREINRQAEENSEVVVTAPGNEGQVTVSPVEKQAHPKEKKPLDITISIKAPGVFVVRVWSGMVLFAGQGKMNKIPIVPKKPISVRITQ